MANNLIEMNIIKEIFRRLLANQSQRFIASELKVHRLTIKTYMDALSYLSIDYAAALALADLDLVQQISIAKQRDNHLKDKRIDYLQTQFSYYDKELTRTGVTLLLLWEEYKTTQTDYYSYTQFAYHYKQYRKVFKAAMHFEHKAAECLQIDFAGDLLNYIDVNTGELIACQILIGTLPFSGYSVAVALPSQKQQDFVSGIAIILKKLGGVPFNIKMDNLKSGVVKPDRYEPVFTDLMLQLALHYNTNLTAARVRKPKDKPHVENAVQQVYRNVYAKLRDATFTSMQDLNTNITALMDLFNKKPFQGKDYSRADLLIEERKDLKQLPSQSFELVKQRQAKVTNSYHIQLGEDKHFYSVPFIHIGQTVMVHYNTSSVQIYDSKFNKIAQHARIIKAYGYTTVALHMPTKHQQYQNQLHNTAQYYLNEANKIGQFTHSYMLKLLQSKTYEQQTYESCKGLLRLVEIYTAPRLEKACERLAHIQIYSYKQAKNVLDNRLDIEDNSCSQNSNIDMPKDHKNQRGAAYYN